MMRVENTNEFAKETGVILMEGRHPREESEIDTRETIVCRGQPQTRLRSATLSHPLDNRAPDVVLSFGASALRGFRAAVFLDAQHNLAAVSRLRQASTRGYDPRGPVKCLQRFIRGPVVALHSQKVGIELRKPKGRGVLKCLQHSTFADRLRSHSGIFFPRAKVLTDCKTDAIRIRESIQRVSLGASFKCGIYFLSVGGGLNSAGLAPDRLASDVNFSA